MTFNAMNTRGKNMVFFFASICLLSSLIPCLCDSKNDEQKTRNENNELFKAQNKDIKNIKRILFWKYNILDSSKELSRNPLKEIGCKQTDCELYYSSEAELVIPHEDFDAIIFQNFMKFNLPYFENRPLVRKPNQRYIFSQMESPSYTLPFSNFKEGFYNWTMTYRRDSDIFWPYGWIGDKQWPHFPNKTVKTWKEPTFKTFLIPESLENKTRNVMVFVSNCGSQSEREHYVSELAAYIDIDVYGSCGTHYTTSKTWEDDLLVNTYKFYLSFENSLCKDYVTEKFFRTLQYDIVPIVYGGADYAAIAPPLSYINVRDYESPAHLAEHLLYLDRNPQEYAKYFWWKQHYTSYRNIRESLCQLCEMLHDPNLPAKAYHNLDSWWNEDACHSASEHFPANEDKWTFEDQERYANLLFLR